VPRCGHDRNNPWHPPSGRYRFSLDCRDCLSSPLDDRLKRFQSVGPCGLTDESTSVHSSFIIEALIFAFAP
jgi:hypothetical protein